MQNLEESIELIEKNKNKKEDDLLFLTNCITTSENLDISKTLPYQDQATDTNDLFIENEFDFENLKKNYLNNLISWSFLKKISEFNQWPLGCLGNIIENSLKSQVNSKNIYVDVRAYNKYVYSGIERNFPNEITENFKKEKFSRHEGITLNNVKDFSNKILVLSIKDDGVGIPTSEFNKFLYSLSTNENNEYNFFKFGISLKTSAIRLANSFLIISKTKNEVNISLISKNLQNKLDTDYILTPIVNYSYENNLTYVAKSNLSQQSLNLILNEIKFLFFDQDEIFNYITNIKTGTHIFLFDLKQITSNKNDINELKNYELLFDPYFTNDIYFNFFDIQIGEKSFIDGSFKRYIKYLFLKFKEDCDFYLYGKKIILENPIKNIYEIFKNKTEEEKKIKKLSVIKHNLKYEGDKVKAFLINNEIYNGIIYTEELIKSIMQEYKLKFPNSFEDLSDIPDLFNGILLYSNNRLIARSKQNKFGEIKYFVKKYEKFYEKNKKRKSKFLFPISGYIELPLSTYNTLYNKTVNKFFI